MRQRHLLPPEEQMGAVPHKEMSVAVVSICLRYNYGRSTVPRRV